MRILRVVHRLYPPKLGGLSQYAHQLSTSQARAGHQVTVLTTREGNFPKHEFRDGYEIYRFKALAWPWENPITLGILPKLLSYDEEDFDILDAHSHLMFTTNIAALKKHLSPKPLVIVNHGFRVRRGITIEFAQDAYLSTLGRHTLATADYVISLTKQERDKTVSDGVAPSKAIMIPNGVDTEIFHPMPSDPIPYSVIWTGRYVAEKGLQNLLQALKMLTPDYPQSKLLLVGEGPELPNLIKFTKSLSLEDNVVFLAPRPYKDIAPLLNRCTLFALPSLTEGFPSAVLEAMACEKPIVATSGIGLEEVLDDASILVPPANPHPLANAIKEIFDNADLRTRLGKRAREKVITDYNWREVVSRINNLFEMAVKEKT